MVVPGYVLACNMSVCELYFDVRLSQPIRAHEHRCFVKMERFLTAGLLEDVGSSDAGRKPDHTAVASNSFQAMHKAGGNRAVVTARRPNSQQPGEMRGSVMRGMVEAECRPIGGEERTLLWRLTLCRSLRTAECREWPSMGTDLLRAGAASHPVGGARPEYRGRRDCSWSGRSDSRIGRRTRYRLRLSIPRELIPDAGGRCLQNP